MEISNYKERFMFLKTTRQNNASSIMRIFTVLTGWGASSCTQNRRPVKKPNNRTLRTLWFSSKMLLKPSNLNSSQQIWVLTLLRLKDKSRWRSTRRNRKTLLKAFSLALSPSVCRSLQILLSAARTRRSKEQWSLSSQLKQPMEEVLTFRRKTMERERNLIDSASRCLKRSRATPSCLTLYSQQMSRWYPWTRSQPRRR